MCLQIAGLCMHLRFECSAAFSSCFALPFPSPHPGMEFRRPLSTNWAGTLSLNCQRTTCLDEHGHKLTHDGYSAPLTCSGRTHDDMVVLSSSTSYK